MIVRSFMFAVKSLSFSMTSCGLIKPFDVPLS